jgi:hypothetical protein
VRAENYIHAGQPAFASASGRQGMMVDCAAAA